MNTNVMYDVATGHKFSLHEYKSSWDMCIIMNCRGCEAVFPEELRLFHPINSTICLSDHGEARLPLCILYKLLHNNFKNYV